MKGFVALICGQNLTDGVKWTFFYGEEFNNHVFFFFKCWRQVYSCCHQDANSGLVLRGIHRLWFVCLLNRFKRDPKHVYEVA